jgi:NAD(P)H-hydrate epimerase
VLPARALDGHKGTFGTVSVIGGCYRGSDRYVGAPALAALGALRSGCGLCRVLAPAPLIQSVLGIVSSATGVALGVDRDGGVTRRKVMDAVIAACAVSDALVVGPGLGRGPGVDAVVRWLWKSGGTLPLVLDADGLNTLAAQKAIAPAAGPVVITPHPGEARRLVEALGISGDPFEQSDRERVADSLAIRLGCIVVLKGAGTIVSDGKQRYANTSGGPWLATGGTGDVLAGVIGGLLAQDKAARPTPHDYFADVCAAVHAHGRAGDAWAKEKNATGGMLAVELAERVAPEIERMRKAPVSQSRA